MATCVQQLYMIPAARDGILTSSVGDGGKHPMTLQELQRMFAYLRDSERKAYNPLSFCKTYEMDHQPLNTGEQKDMAEFFIDLLSKMEEMSPELKIEMRKLFCGTLTNNVVSLDCNHVSRTAEEFYTVRCQVSGKNFAKFSKKILFLSAMKLALELLKIEIFPSMCIETKS